MVALLNALAEHLGSHILGLHDYLNHPNIDKKACEFLRNKKIRTSYLSRSGEKCWVKFGGFSIKNALQQHAYEGYLGVTIAQVYFTT